MPSPFPGLDPYLEQFWGDVHTRFMVYACDQLNEQLPADLQARVEESLTVDMDDGWRTVYPDVRIAEEGRGGPATQTAASITIDKACFVPFPSDPPTQRHIEIIDPNSGHKVVTVIELLSPANKTSESGRRAYRSKQREYLAGGTNLVEIDLLREGAFIVAVPEALVPAAYRKWGIVCVRRAVGERGAELYRASIRERLPNVPVPLRPSDADAVLQLQLLLDDCYRRGRYDTLDYRQAALPRLDAEDAAWSDALLRAKGLR